MISQITVQEGLTLILRLLGLEFKGRFHQSIHWPLLILWVISHDLFWFQITMRTCPYSHFRYKPIINHSDWTSAYLTYQLHLSVIYLIMELYFWPLPLYTWLSYFRLIWHMILLSHISHWLSWRLIVYISQYDIIILLMHVIDQ